MNKNLVQRSFSHAAPHYNEAADLQRRVLERAMILAREVFSASGTIADLGCGTGNFAIVAPDSWRVVGIDIAYGMCQQAQKQCMVANGRMEALPFATALFDGVFSSLALQWVENVPDALREMKHLLKPNGQIVLTSFAENTLTELRQSFAAMDADEHINHFTSLDGWKGWAEEAGLQVHQAFLEEQVEYYMTAGDILRQLKIIGAANRQNARSPGLITPRHWAKMEKAYEAKRMPQGLPVTWEIVTMVLS